MTSACRPADEARLTSVVPSHPRGRLPVAFSITSALFLMSARSFSTFCMLRWV